MYRKLFIFFHSIKSLPKIAYHKNFRDSLTTVFLFLSRKVVENWQN
nr:MAG TPA: hypothetical protein [Caudoviricetes sp.]